MAHVGCDLSRSGQEKHWGRRRCEAEIESRLAPLLQLAVH